MNRNRNIIITSVFLLLAFAALTFAHGGFDHVMGSVVKVENNVLTVKTARGVVAVKLDAKTEFTKSDHPAAIADLIPGSRVVVDIKEGDKDKLAHSVKIGAAGTTDHDHGHDNDHDHDHK